MYLKKLSISFQLFTLITINLNFKKKYTEALEISIKYADLDPIFNVIKKKYYLRLILEFFCIF